YSGHGTRCIVTDGQRRISREALLPKDKIVGPERRFLFDWELNQLIAKIASRTSRATVILDCCSSGGATRGAPDAADKERFWPTFDDVQGDVGGAIGIAAALGRVERCQVIAACREDERAKESVSSEGLVQGELTRALVAQLATIPTAELMELHWGQIWRALE